jgi:hypothetical protein
MREDVLTVCAMTSLTWTALQPHFFVLTPCLHAYFMVFTPMLRTAAADAWASHPWPAFFIKAPDLPHYQRSVPEQRLLSDISGESEQVI